MSQLGSTDDEWCDSDYPIQEHPSKRIRLDCNVSYEKQVCFYGESYEHDDTTPWEIHPADIGSQLVLLKVLAPRVEYSPEDYNTISLSGRMLEKDSYTFYQIPPDETIVKVSAESFRVIWFGQCLPCGLDSSNIIAHVLHDNNTLGVCSDHVFYLERYDTGDSDEEVSELQSMTSGSESASSGDVHSSFGCITALCTHDGLMIPHPAQLFPVTMSYATVESIPISNCIHLISAGGVRTRQYCDPRHYATVYHSNILLPILSSNEQLIEPLLSLDAYQKNKRSLIRQHDRISASLVYPSTIVEDFTVLGEGELATSGVTQLDQMVTPFPKGYEECPSETGSADRDGEKSSTDAEDGDIAWYDWGPDMWLQPLPHVVTEDAMEDGGSQQEQLLPTCPPCGGFPSSLLTVSDHC